MFAVRKEWVKPFLAEGAYNTYNNIIILTTTVV